MHIGFLTPEYPGKTSTAGGIATSIKSLAEALTESGHSVTIFIYGQKEDTVCIEKDIRFITIGMDSKPLLTWWTNRRKIEKCINAEVVKNGVELIEAPDWTGITATMRLNIPLMIRIHGSDTYFCKIEGRKQKWKNFFFEKLALRSADHIVSVSRFAADKTREFFHLKNTIEVIPNGVDVTQFQPGASSSLSKPVILYLGTIIRKKGVLDLAEIFNRVIERNEEATLRLIGADTSDVFSGSSSTWALMQEMLTPKAREHTEYLGKIPHEEITGYVGEATVCVFPSYAEAFPIAWLEAMASAKAIVASNIGWAEECLEDEKSALLEYPAHHDAFAEKILKVLENKKLAENLGTEARKRVEAYFSVEKVVQKNIKFYIDIRKKEKNDSHHT